MTKCLTIFLLMLSCVCFAQDDKKGTIKVKKVPISKSVDSVITIPEDIPILAISSPFKVETLLTIVEQMPKFPGGAVEMKKFISNTMQYPKSEKESAPSGKVYITFTVEVDGSLTDVKVLSGISGCSACDAEALRVVKSMPKWVAGKQNNVAVPVQCTIPIDFTIK
ncbi:hypothetical protein BH10BAC1_BH10BAC1_15410 [soil metagenome]